MLMLHDRLNLVEAQNQLVRELLPQLVGEVVMRVLRSGPMQKCVVFVDKNMLSLTDMSRQCSSCWAMRVVGVRGGCTSHSMGDERREDVGTEVQGWSTGSRIKSTTERGERSTEAKGLGRKALKRWLIWSFKLRLNVWWTTLFVCEVFLTVAIITCILSGSTGVWTLKLSTEF